MAMQRPRSVMAISMVRLSYLNRLAPSADPSFDGVAAAVCTQMELTYAIVATTLPCLKPFMAALNTRYGGTTAVNMPSSGTKASNTTTTINSSAYALGGLSPTSKHRLDSKNGNKTEAELADGDVSVAAAPAPAHYNVEVHVGDHASLGSDDSNRLIIAKHTSWAVDFHDPPRDDNV